jgi:hypothetical protein
MPISTIFARMLRENPPEEGAGMLPKSYKRVISKQEAERFWSIFPPKQGETNIVAFPIRS